MGFNYFNFIVHVLIGTLFVAALAYSTARQRLMRDWPPDRARLQVIVVGVYWVSLAAVWVVFALGPTAWFYFLAAATPYVAAVLVARRIKKHDVNDHPAGSGLAR